MEYRVFFTNHNYYSDEVFQTLDAAIAYGKTKCFEFSVVMQVAGANPYENTKCKTLICAWGPIEGLRWRTRVVPSSVYA